MKYNTIIEETPEINWTKGTVRVKIEYPRILTNTSFLEHVTDIFGNPTNMLIAKQTNEILTSDDFGSNWEKFDIGFNPEKCFTLSNGNHLLYDSEGKSLVLLSNKWEKISETGGFPYPWHGTWSIGESPDGTIIWGEYAYSDDSLSVFRSTDGALNWQEVLTVSGGGEDPKAGKIRHFHTCQNDPSSSGKWLISSGDTDSQCRMWSSTDDGISWSEITFEPDDISGTENRRIVSPKLWRRTAETIVNHSIIFPTDDNHYSTGSRLVKMDRENPSKAEIIGHLGPNEVRNFVQIEDGFFVSISESKNEKDSIFVHLCHPEFGATPLLEIPNELKLKSNFCNSISSKKAINGVFWTFQDGIAIRKKPKIMRWTVSLEDSIQNSEESYGTSAIEQNSNQESYPETLSPSEAIRNESPFISPIDPSRRDEQIDQILERATQDGIFNLPRYDPSGAYLTLHKSNILNNRVVEFDEDLGIPVNKYAHMEDYHPYPVSIGLFALEQYSKFIQNSGDEHLSNFRKVCKWIIANQQSEGSWPCTFEYTFFKDRGGYMPKGWVSALAQGYCISSLCRYLEHVRTNEGDKELESIITSKIENALKPFDVDVEFGGIKRLFMGEYIFYEEYPTPKPSFVLNGFIFSLLGLYDAWKVIESDDAKRLYLAGIRTLVAILPFFDLGDRTSYDLTHLQPGNEKMPPNPARRGYHDTHIRLLDAIDGIEGGQFSDVLVRWIMYRYGISCSNN